MFRMQIGSEFHAAGPATVNELSANAVIIIIIIINKQQSSLSPKSLCVSVV